MKDAFVFYTFYFDGNHLHYYYDAFVVSLTCTSGSLFSNAQAT